MNLSRALFALALLIVFGSRVHAQGTNTWADGFPKTGDVVQTIKVQGTVHPAVTWSPTGVAKVQFIQAGGGVVIWNLTTLTVDKTSGNWGPTGALDIPGQKNDAGQNVTLTSTVNYNVVVMAELKKGLFTKTFIGTDSKQAVAK